ncbi:sialate O-acetylesterase [Sphingomonadaceae bacterium OTU29THOMA1]|nr:sialate O-acetylesterase [Sphingomonadaceae bacterium OTU29THOMA1]
MIVRHIAIAGFVAIGVPATGPAASPVEAEVYILAGQSNMSGRGALSELSTTDRVADERITVYGNGGMLRVALDPLDDASGQVDAVSADRQAAVGPGLPFARAMLRRHGRAILLVPCAKGGSSMAQWAPGGDRSTLYGSCIARAREAGGRIAGMLWYQGESDARDVATAARWSAAFADLVTAFRRDLRMPQLAVSAVSLSDRPVRDADRYPGWTDIQRQQTHLKIACTDGVSAAGLPHNADDLHLATRAQQRLGTMLAGSMTRLRREGCR